MNDIETPEDLTSIQKTALENSYMYVHFPVALEEFTLGTYTEIELYQNLEKCFQYSYILKLLTTELFAKFKKHLHFDQINSLIISNSLDGGIKEENFILRINYNLSSKTSIILYINKYFSIIKTLNNNDKKCCIL